MNKTVMSLIYGSYYQNIHDMQSSAIMVIKSKGMRLAGHVACMGRGEVHTGFWWGNLRERDHLEDLDGDGCVILKWILKKWDVGAWTGSSWLRIWTVGGLL
jgi:hypothetical protein